MADRAAGSRCRRVVSRILPALVVLSALGPAAEAQSAPSISINDVSKVEGDAVNDFTFTVSLSEPSAQTVTVKRATADGTAIADEDYLPLFATGPAVTFSPGQTSKQVIVEVIGDISTELDEDFFVNLSGAANATISDGAGRGVIETDDTTTGAFFTPTPTGPFTPPDYAHIWTVPPGVTAATFNLAGARGGGPWGGAGGGFRATLTGLQGHRPLAICLGGRGVVRTGFFERPVMGGGGEAVGGFSGGGATDVRIGDDCGLNASLRLLVAGGGGGQGGDALYCNADAVTPPPEEESWCPSAAGPFGVCRAGSPEFACNEVKVNAAAGFGGSAATAAAPNGTPAGDSLTYLSRLDRVTPLLTGGRGGNNGGGLSHGSGGAGAGAVGQADPADVLPGTAGGAGASAPSGSVGGAGGTRPFIRWVDKLFARGGTGGGGGAGFFAGGGGGGGGAYVPNNEAASQAASLADFNIGVTAGGGGGAGSNCMGLGGDQTCAGAATPIHSVDRVLSNFRSDSGDGELAIWYPDASISSPAPNTSVLQSGALNASFSCSVGKADPQIETCSATVTPPGGPAQSVASGQSLPTGAVGTYSLVVTAVDDLGGTRRLERLYTVTAASAPVNQAVPTITGEPVVGQTLTASDGTWTGTDPITVTHQWQRCNIVSCTNIPGATGDTYVVTAEDRGAENEVNTLLVRAVAQNVAGTTFGYSSQTLPVKNQPALPIGPSVIIEGGLSEGETLRRRFSGPPLILSFDFDFITQWHRCVVPFGCEPITGENGFSYTLTSADIGARIKVSLQLRSYSIGTSVAESAISAQVAAATPAISVDDALQYEPDAGNSVYEFVVTRTGTPAGLAGASTVHWETGDGTGTTADNDYEQASGDVAFAPGETSKKILVTVNGDARFERSENFFVNLSSPTGAALADGQAIGRIQGDDGRPRISIDDVTKPEGNVGTTAYTFTVSLSNPSYQTVGVTRQSANASATTGDSDFAALAAAPITFSPGQTSRQVTVNVGGDTAVEPDEHFFVNLSGASNATISDNQGMGSIRNDDVDRTAPNLVFRLSPRQSLGTALRRGIRGRATTDEAGRLVVRAYVDRRTARRLAIRPNARRDVVVGTLRRDIEAGRSAISVKLSRKARRRMKAAGRVKLRLRAAITDSAGNDSSRTVALTLRR